jgi:hypothetical protein
MVGDNGEEWRVLCEQASKEQDPEKLRELIKEINRLLEAKHQHLHNKSLPKRNLDS